jgi:Ca-activated chloride channel family protein
VITLANGAKGADPFGWRAEFVQLARAAKTAAGLPDPKTGQPTLNR